MNSITHNSNRDWIIKHPLKLHRYLRRNHRRQDRELVSGLILNHFPDQGRKLVSNFSLSVQEKVNLLLEWLYHEPQITTGIFGDQRMGKDALICEVFQLIIDFCEDRKLTVPRFVTLGNLRRPPFVDDDDMYFSFKHIPSGKKGEEVWIYCSEIETVLPSREGNSPENRLFSQLEGTMAQNHQKLFGACKLAAKVDINFIRGMNVRLVKYISPEKLNVENVERANVISHLAQWHLPGDKFDKANTLLCFDNQIFNISFGLPAWWSDEYSEQFKDVPLEKIQEYVEVVFSNGMSPPQIEIAVAQKFRKIVSKDWILRVVK